MRPKLIALIAVSAVALVGCSAGEPSAEPVATVTVTATPEPEVATQETPAEPVEAVEEQFADFAELRAPMNEAKMPDRDKVIDGLHDFCEDGKTFNVSKTEDLNKNLDAVAEMAYCDRLESK